MRYDAIIIGGGAAGLFCANEAGKRGRKVLVIEHNTQLGRKIIISGGGRCNFTNIHTGPENFISGNPHFSKSALARYTPNDFVALVKKHKIEYYEKKLGQLFCRESSRSIVEMLVTECERAGVAITTGCTVRSVAKQELFEVDTNKGQYTAEKIVVATGGLSFAKVGATDLGYAIANQFGLAITETRPSLVALVMAGENRFTDLAGVSVDAEVSANGKSFRENVLFTHRGLSGPAILQVSNYWKPGEPVGIDLMPDQRVDELIAAQRGTRQRLDNFLGRYLPASFASRFVSKTLPNKPVDQLSKREIDEISKKVNNWQVRFSKTEGYDRAEVTLGGVSTDELSSATMESNRVEGLYFIGEVVDVTGWLGGYNFQWAWSSGYAAGQAI